MKRRGQYWHTIVVAAIASLATIGDARAEYRVEWQQVDDLKAVFATVESTNVVAARARIGGTVRDLGIDEGDAVEKGQVIATVVDEKLPLRIAALESQINALEARYRQARTNLERAETLRQRGIIPQASLDDARTDRDVVAAELAARRAEGDLASQQLAEGAVEAPTSGRVLTVPVVDGTVIMPGESIAIVASEDYRLRLALPERHARFIKIGDTVLVGKRGLALDDAAEERRQGTVTQVYPRLEGGKVIADAQISGLGDFFVGERTRVWIVTDTRKIIVVPRDYLIQRQGLTFVRLESGKEIVVQPGSAIDGAIEILSGLRPGDVLVMP